MHILFLTDNFPPETNAPASRTYEHAREWVALGHKVTVITCAPNFPNGKVFEGYRNRLWQSEQLDGVRVIRVWTYITANEGNLKRILDYLSFMLSGFLASLFIRRPDVIVGTSPQFFTAVAAWGSSFLRRRPFVFELRDIWPESIRVVDENVKAARILDALEKVEIFLYRRADAIISVTHSFKTALIERGIDGEKICVVTNGVDTMRFAPIAQDGELSAGLDLSNKFVVGYIGTHGMAHALHTLLEAAHILQKDADTTQVQFIFLGAGARLSELKETAQALSLKNVVFLDNVPREQVARYWSLLDLSVVHLKRTELFKTVIPSKIFECMAMGVPILHGVEGESAKIVQSSGAGLTFEPENSVELAMLIKELWQCPDRLQDLRANGPKTAALYDRRRLASEMVDIFASIAR